MLKSIGYFKNKAAISCCDVSAIHWLINFLSRKCLPGTWSWGNNQTYPQCKTLFKTIVLHSSKKVIIKERKKASDYSRLKRLKETQLEQHIKHVWILNENVSLIKDVLRVVGEIQVLISY